ncbi:gluconokinase [Rodentibacter caecimuris]|uniref:Gluconokinase n=1 Tax=Rodentibacter caecimuris TaxID=1796644 RepID=A0ABX3L0Z1_9PAST|nr:gluconate kinase [Rodentibacter heylii]
MSQGRAFILMGTSGSGKSSVGTALANRLGIKFIDGDDLHPRANIIKMSNNQPLNDDDRAPWLERINDAAFSLEQKNERGIIVCSALKKTYRDQIRRNNKRVRFIFLQGDFELILNRMKRRHGHYMKTDMLKSQFEILETPQDDESDIVFISIDADFEEVVEQCATVMKPYL